MRIKLNVTSAIRFGTLLIAVISLIALLGTSWFIYNNVYLPLTQAIFVAELKSRIALVVVDKVKLRQVQERIAADVLPPSIDWTSLRNPFVPAPPLPVPATETPPSTVSNNP